MIDKQVARRDVLARGFRLTCNRKGNWSERRALLTAGAVGVLLFDARACKAHAYLEPAPFAKRVHSPLARCRRRRCRTSCQNNYRNCRNDDFRNHACSDPVCSPGFHDTHMASGYKEAFVAQKKVADPKARHHFLTNLPTFDLLERVASAYEDTRSNDVVLVRPAVCFVLLVTEEVRLLVKQVLDTYVQAE